MPSDVQNPTAHIRLHVFFRVKDVSQYHDHNRNGDTELVDQTLSRIRDSRVSIQCRIQTVRQPAQIAEGIHTKLPIKLARKCTQDTDDLHHDAQEHKVIHSVHGANGRRSCTTGQHRNHHLLHQISQRQIIVDGLDKRLCCGYHAL